MKKYWFLGLAALSFFVAQPISAHSIWLQEEDGAISVLYGHAGENEAEGYEPNKVQEVSAIDLDGNPVSVEINRGAEQVDIIPSSDAALVAVSFDNGFWVETADGWQNVSKREVDEYISSSHTLKYTKALYDWSDAVAEPVGLPLEIVPMSNPFELGVGDELQIQVLYNGEPVSGVDIYSTGGEYVEDEPSAIVTDENGMATVPIVEPGFQVLEASLRLPLENNPDADEIGHSSTLTFALD